MWKTLMNNNNNNNNNNNRPQNKSEGKWKGYVPRPGKRIEKAVEHESDDCTNCDWGFWHNN